MNVAQDWYGQAIGLQFAIIELRNQVTVDVCVDHPRLVTLALAGLQLNVDRLVASIADAIVQNTPVDRTEG